MKSNVKPQIRLGVPEIIMNNRQGLNVILSNGITIRHSWPIIKYALMGTMIVNILKIVDAIIIERERLLVIKNSPRYEKIVVDAPAMLYNDDDNITKQLIYNPSKSFAYQTPLKNLNTASIW